MAKFEINEAALQKVAQDAVKQAVTQVDRDMSSYRGKPVEEVWPALERAMRDTVSSRTRGTATSSGWLR